MRKLDPGDRKILIIAGVVLLALMVATFLITPPREEDRGYPSTYSPASDGAKAAYLLLKDLDYDVERWEASPLELAEQGPADELLLILADPFPTADARERHALHQFIRQGGIVLATGFGATLLPESELGVDINRNPMAWEEFTPAMPSPLAHNADRIVMSPRNHWRMRHGQHLAIYEIEGRSGAGITVGSRDQRTKPPQPANASNREKYGVVVTYRYGEGQVIWWAAPTPLSNSGILLEQNLALFLNSVGQPGERRILWDEYFHGHGGSLWDYLARTPVPWGLAQMGLVFAAVVLTFARRSGPMRAPQPESRLSPLEFVSTLGGLYHRAHAAQAAVSIAYHRFRYLLCRRLGLPPDSGPGAMHEAARQRLGWREPGLLETLQQCDRVVRGSETTDPQALKLVQALQHYTQLLKLAPGRPDGGGEK